VHSGGSAVLAMDRGERVSFTFKGTGISWVGYSDEWSGIARVYINSAFVTTVDTYSAPHKAQTILFKKEGLSPGTHTITIEATGRRRQGSAGPWIWVDAFDVKP
jgi:hypothetical protein